MHTQIGHRQRVRDRFLSEGLDSFDEVHALELLLFYAIAQRDTKPLARALLDRFGSLPLVLEASQEELMAVKGVGEGVATFLRLIPAAGRYYQTHRDQAAAILNTTEKCGNYLLAKYFGRKVETVFLLCLDSKCKLIHCAMVGEGDVNSANIPLRRIVEIALRVNASTVILAHNHPGGLALPSREDIYTTIRLGDTMAAMGICLADHIVIAGDEFVSMTESGMFTPPAI